MFAVAIAAVAVFGGAAALLNNEITPSGAYYTDTVEGKMVGNASFEDETPMTSDVPSSEEAAATPEESPTTEITSEEPTEQEEAVSSAAPTTSAEEEAVVPSEEVLLSPTATPTPDESQEGAVYEEE